MTGEILSMEVIDPLTRDSAIKVVFGQINSSDMRYEDEFTDVWEPQEWTLEISPKSNDWTNWSRLLEPGNVLSGLKDIAWKEGYIDPASKPKLEQYHTPAEPAPEQGILL